MPPRDEAQLPRAGDVTSPSVAPESVAVDVEGRIERQGFWLFAGHLLTIWGLALSNAFVGLTILWSVVRARHLPWSWRRDAALFAPAALYAIAYTASVLTSIDRSVSLPEMRDLLSFATLLLAPVLVRGERRARQLVTGIVVMIVLLSLHGIGQYLFTDFGDLHRRIIGLFSHYQTFAGVLVIGALVLAARLGTADGWRRPLNWVAFAIVVSAVLLSLTRGAWVATAIGLVTLALVRAKRVVLVALAAALLVAVLLPGTLTERLRSIADLDDPSNYDRLCMAEAAFFMIEERPLFGIGPDMARELYPIYRHPSAPRITVPHLHNAFLQRAAEQGLVSSIAYLALMAAAVVLAWRAYRLEGDADGPRADLHLAVVLVVVGFNVAGLFEDNWRDTEVRRLVLFFLALPLCLGAPTARLAESSGAESDEVSDEMRS